MEQSHTSNQTRRVENDVASVGLFVDSENLSLWIQTQAPGAATPFIDYSALVRFAGGIEKLSSAAVYTSRISRDEKHLRFLVALKRETRHNGAA